MAAKIATYSVVVRNPWGDKELRRYSKESDAARALRHEAEISENDPSMSDYQIIWVGTSKFLVVDCMNVQGRTHAAIMIVENFSA